MRISSPIGYQKYNRVLEFATTESILSKCSFGRVVGLSQLGNSRPDLIVDLTIRRAERGSGGLINNPNLAVVDVAMVLSDGQDESLLGSAELRGKSSAVAIGSSNPENQAFAAVAKRISEILAKSGCYGQRLARPSPAPQPPVPVGPTPATPEQIAQAEAANTEGKRLFRAANIAAAKGFFLQATAIVADPRYYFNLCLSHEALSEFDAAQKACQAVLDTHPAQRLIDKATQRLAIIAERRGG